MLKKIFIRSKSTQGEEKGNVSAEETPAQTLGIKEESLVKPSKAKKYWKKILIVSVVLASVALGLYLWTESAEKSARWVPSYEQEVLPSFDLVSDLNQEELQLFYAQTGLTAVGLARLEETNRLTELDVFQRAYFLEAVEMEPEDSIGLETPFTQLPMHCEKNSIISWEEYLLDTEGNRGSYLPIVPLEVGDILLTPNSHTFGWRQGHAGIVVDTENWLSLECLVLGQNSKTQWLGKWTGFPAVIILRPKEEGLGEIAAEYAMEFLFDKAYDLTVGVLSSKYKNPESMAGTHCSHLVWQAYAWCGVDIDSNGGTIIAPQDIVQSQELEVVQIWGVNPEVLWNS